MLKSISNFLHFFTMLMLSMAILYLRNFDSLINPVIYTEDGVWIGMALSNGWINTLINAKEGYFFWGNILLLWGSVFLSDLFCGDKLSCLPYTISLFSVLFFSSIAVFCYDVTKGLISYLFRLFLFFFMLLLPLGDSSNEIFGRISNIGYWCVLLTLLLFFYKEKTKKKYSHG